MEDSFAQRKPLRFLFSISSSLALALREERRKQCQGMPQTELERLEIAQTSGRREGVELRKDKGARTFDD
jgi:hypothetical protein